MLKIENPRNGLNKKIPVSGYSIGELVKICKCYTSAGFVVTFLG